jgi:hypothetical protein
MDSIPAKLSTPMSGERSTTAASGTADRVASMARHSIQAKIWALFQNLGTLLLLAIAFPFNLAIVTIALISNRLRRYKTIAPANPQKNILIAGGRMTKSLQLARSFHAAGHRSIPIDTEKFWCSGNQYSIAVAAFYTVPDPAIDLSGYIARLREIAIAEQIDLFIPVAIFSTLYFAGMSAHPLADLCEICHFDRETLHMVDDKYAFAERARSLGLTVPKSVRITAPEQVLNFDFASEQRQFILKSIPYDAKLRLDLTKLPCSSPEETAKFVNSLPISEAKPWILQEFIPGTEYCTHSTVRDGRSTLYCCCKSSAFQVNYAHVDNPEITTWVDKFLAATPGFGQASFDFIQAEDGTAYAIECNPRTHSAITTFYDHPGVAAAYLDPAATPILPLTASKPTYWLYHELWRLTAVRSLTQLQSWFSNIWSGKEAVLALDDPLPFLMVHHWQIPIEVFGGLWQLKSWIRIDFNIGELIE